MHMSCRIAVNMAKRAAAGAMPPVYSPAAFEPSDAPRRNTQRTSSSVLAAKRDPGRIFAIALSGLVALSFVCYAVYAHQWSELSAMRHLGNPTEQNGYW
jgi:hypothetical protein